ncbi:MAG TPA: methyltransferase domain-containing protein [Polyangiales bacterium]|nr:methyltransferase domain-containing protein [Polyangiales bacterium]
MRELQLTVEPVPAWLDAARLLGSDRFTRDGLSIRASLPAPLAADVVARLRGLGIDGQPLHVTCTPELARSEVRAARLRDARARRETTPGFQRPGARATGEGRYSLTPELLALALGRRASGASVVDACCGSGGNAIGFARAGSQVVAIELDPARLDEARHNAAVYGVSKRIELLCGDARELVPARAADILFVDPPWGEQYDKRACTLDDFPLLSALLALPPRGYRELWLKLPASFRVASVPAAEPHAYFGEAPGDRHRLKFLLLRRPG